MVTYYILKQEVTPGDVNIINQTEYNATDADIYNLADVLGISSSAAAASETLNAGNVVIITDGKDNQTAYSYTKDDTWMLNTYINNIDDGMVEKALGEESSSIVYEGGSST